MAKKKLYELTLIRERIVNSGRMTKWYAMQIGYAPSSTEFYKVVDGRKVPSSHRRVLLAHMLHTTPDILWGICPKNGDVVALKVMRRLKPKVDSKPMRRLQKENYIKLTPEMIALFDRWCAVHTIGKLATEIGVTRNYVDLPFKRKRDGMDAGIRQGVWEMVEGRINLEIKEKGI